LSWTPEAVLALAPDLASAKSGQGLAAARQWSTLGRHADAIWGEIKGSGSKPYQTRIDLREPAFKCTCPSRKFPCKHGIGLMLIFAREVNAFPDTAMPDWVSEWLSGREQRAEKKAEYAATPQPMDAEAQRKRADQREGRIATGLDQINLWLQDLVRSGLAQAQSQPASLWDAMAARLVDAQAPGLARLVNNIEEALRSGPGCEARALHAIASLDLVRRAYGSRERLPDEVVNELRSAVGWTVREEGVVASATAVHDRWFVLGSRMTIEDRLRVRRTWLQGLESRRTALVLDFAAGTQPMHPGLPLGREVEADLAFYPGSLGLRAVFRASPAASAKLGSLPGTDIEPAMGAYAEALAKAPWLERWPIALSQVRLLRTGEPQSARWHLVDRENRRIDLSGRFAHGWTVMAIAGGEAIDVMGEWDGDTLLPLALGRGDQYYAVGESVIATREVA